MSHAHEHTSSAQGGLSLSTIATSATDLISPRNGAGEAPSIFRNVWGIGTRTAGLIQHTLATAVDVPFSLAEAGFALPNNLLGLATTAIDRAVVRPIDWTRHMLFKLLNANPFSPSAAPAVHPA